MAATQVVATAAGTALQINGVLQDPTAISGTNVGTAIASAASIAPTQMIHHITGTNAIATITPPAFFTGSTGGVLYLIPDAAFTTTTAGNIALASTAVLKKLLIMVYDPGTSKWYPSY